MLLICETHMTIIEQKSVRGHITKGCQGWRNKGDYGFKENLFSKIRFLFLKKKTI